MSEYEQVIDEIVKHGVTVKVNKIVDDNYIPYERKYVGCVVELDFSEHDKVFEDKIAELKKDYKTASELLGKYQRENEVLKKRIQELDTIDTIRIDENRELKQRIAELESMETEKPTKCTTVIVAKEINGQTYVTLDDFMSVVNDLQAKIGT